MMVMMIIIKGNEYKRGILDGRASGSVASGGREN
jgi:hypothetical protein